MAHPAPFSTAGSYADPAPAADARPPPPPPEHVAVDIPEDAPAAPPAVPLQVAALISSASAGGGATTCRCDEPAVPMTRPFVRTLVKGAWIAYMAASMPAWLLALVFAPRVLPFIVFFAGVLTAALFAVRVAELLEEQARMETEGEIVVLVVQESIAMTRRPRVSSKL
ncbi:hypothetical protein ACP70R_015349 [Stipagrostis hirtigluma subsp. patula]